MSKSASFTAACAAWILCWTLSGQAAEESPRPANRLAQETSPYLLLHAHNPVDWYPWGPEAFAKAKADGKLIFLSIGYSSCHWCHVMERESFMDDEIAAYLNEHFVCVKVDREERPDVDEIYMTALHIYFQLVGSPQTGGWPLSMFLTPDALPLTGGTYFPPRDVEGREGFLSVLSRVQGIWKKDPKLVAERGKQLADFVKDSLRRRPALDDKPPGPEVLDEIQKALAEEYDAEHGGFGFSETDPMRSKFPQPPNLVFLLDRVRRAPTSEAGKQAREMLEGTLDHMAAGGIRDHVGGGFHRYSTDRYWRIPHFEKMLYDNAQLAWVYAESFALTGNVEHKRVAEETLDFMLRELLDKEGGFYSALDADTAAGEGAFYAWKPAEVREVLGEEYDLFADAYGIKGEPNFEELHVPLLSRPLALAARRHKLDEASLAARLTESREKLLIARNQREMPPTDTKVLTDWNGLAIGALAHAGRVLENDRYIAAAARAADFILGAMRTEDGRLKHAYGGGQARLNAYLDDYAFLIAGLIELHMAQPNEKKWLAAADELMAREIELFWDDAGGGFYFTSGDHEALIARIKDPADSVTPSGNAVSAANLIFLSTALDRPAYRERAQRTIAAFGPLWQQAPASMPQMAVALAELESR